MPLLEPLFDLAAEVLGAGNWSWKWILIVICCSATLLAWLNYGPGSLGITLPACALTAYLYSRFKS